MTFDPLPREVLRPDQPVVYLTHLPTKLELLAKTGLDQTVVVRFTREVSLMSARDFIAWVRHTLPFVELWEGEGFALGHHRTGNLQALAEIGSEMGFSVHTLPLVQVDGQPVSSTRIRQAIMAGDVHVAARLLGHYHIVPGTVVPGSKRGRELGYPTANLATAYNLALPADGVYATWAVRPSTGEVLPSVTSVGTRPTFEDDVRLVEVYIVDYDADLYGQTIQAHFVSFIRPQIKFESITSLVKQMAADTAQATEILAASTPPDPPLGVLP
jgi:riboflavin kinase/FMN adenylyltransferase